jgi:uncharacterized membrane protein
VSAPDGGRLWEVDAVRTLAIAMMVAYHAAYDIGQLAPDLGVDPFSPGWRALQVACGATFLFVVGVSLSISNGRGRAAGLRGYALYRRHLRRALQVAAAAALVSLATWVALGDQWVRFGVLHCIAVGMLVGPLLVRLRWWNVPLGAAVIAAGIWIDQGPRTDSSALHVLGVQRQGATPVDWYPLMPWLGVMMLGLAAGLALYPAGRRGPWTGRLPRPRGARALGAPGRHSLPIYLVHQLVLIPLIAAALALSGVAWSWSGFE